MTKSEAKAAFLAQQPIIHNGIEYLYISGLIYRLREGKVILELEMMGKCLHSVTRAAVERVTLVGNAHLPEGGEE